MRSIEVSKIKDGRILLAPYGVEGDRTPCLLWEDPDPTAKFGTRRIKDKKKLITATTKYNLIAAGRRRGLPVENYYYLPAHRQSPKFLESLSSILLKCPLPATDNK